MSVETLTLSAFRAMSMSTATACGANGWDSFPGWRVGTFVTTSTAPCPVDKGGFPRGNSSQPNTPLASTGELWTVGGGRRTFNSYTIQSYLSWRAASIYRHTGILYGGERGHFVCPFQSTLAVSSSFNVYM